LRRVLRSGSISNKLDGMEYDYLWDSDPDHASSVDDDDDKAVENTCKKFLA
jgi:hypothetical protein